MSFHKVIKSIINWLVVSLAFLLPIFFLPITTEFFTFNKQTLLFLFVGVLLVLWLARMALQKKLSFRKTPFDLPVLILGGAFLVVNLLASPNKALAFAAPEGTGTILALASLFFVISQNIRPATSRRILLALIGSGAFLSLFSLYQYLGIGEVFFSLEKFPWLKNKLFSPAGNILGLIGFLITNLVLAISLFLKEIDQKRLLTTTLTGAASVIIGLGLVIILFQVLPGKERLVFLPLGDTWAIGIESFKQNPLLGTGIGNYRSAFNRFRPISFNQYDFWNTRFTNGSSLPLEFLTIGGLLVLGGYLLLVGQTVRFWLQTFRQKKDQLPLLGGLLLALFLPWFLGNHLLLLFSFFILLALLANLKGEARKIDFPSKALSLVFLLVTVVLVGTAFFFWGKIYWAELAFRQSLDALAQNQGLVVYNLQIKAIQLNPSFPNYRRAYSQTNFGLANAIALQPDLTDQDRTNITQLVQQAIREAKIATALNPTDATNWENLAQIYRNLLNFAQGADQWAIAAYQQAVATDPVNPRLRVNLGGFFYSLRDYETALRQFENAIGLKPDYANGYYNLAATYREREMYPQAYQAMQIVVSLVPGDSADYQTAVNELNQLAEKLPAQATPSAQKEPAKPEEALTEPEPLPSPIISPPIKLPQGGGPEISPTPTPNQ